MDPESDRFLTREVEAVVAGLRKQVDEFKAKEAAAEKEKKDKEAAAAGKLGINTWILIALIVIVLFAMFSGPGPR